MELELEIGNDMAVPLYDRAFSISGITSRDGSSNLQGLEPMEDSRCFNCGSYNHLLKECTRPRDNVAVTSARKQHKPRLNQNGNSRNRGRYYQRNWGGGLDGLKPGALVPETRRALGIEELDPPPWLNRMRELGYPPGYLERPSGITIFGGDENEEDQPPSGIVGGDESDREDNIEEGEIVETRSFSEPHTKMSVEFPGVNAPIPKGADEMIWTTGLSLDLCLFGTNCCYTRRYDSTSDFGRRNHHCWQSSW